MKRILYPILTVILIALMHISVFAQDTEASAQEIQINYVVGNDVIKVICDEGDVVSPIEAEEKYGYLFVGWMTDAGAIYDFSKPVTEDVTLHAVYSLIPAVAIIKDVSFVYDANSRELILDGLYHALEESGGYYTFEWYKDGVQISSTESVSIKNVRDSGIYSCNVTFHYGGESVRTSFEGVRVIIEKCSLTVPKIEGQVYSGKLCVPDVVQSDLYSYDYIYPISAGKYEMCFTLTDDENYRWEGIDTSTCTVVFEVMRAPNKFDGKISVSDVYTGAEMNFDAKSTFGEVRFVYSKTKDGVFTEAVPKIPGSYFVKAVVDENENYYGLQSNPIPFSIIDPSAPQKAENNFAHAPFLIFALILLFALSALSILLFVLTRIAKKRSLPAANTVPKRSNAADFVVNREECESEFSIQLGCERDLAVSDIMGVNAEKADSLISDQLARSLIRRENAALLTQGSGRASISVDVLSDNFLDGDRVDINVLKKRGLISENYAYLEIKGEGYMNKALKVYANEFSLRAVKMIALCGGEAIKVVTIKHKGNKK